MISLSKKQIEVAEYDNSGESFNKKNIGGGIAISNRLRWVLFLLLSVHIVQVNLPYIVVYQFTWLSYWVHIIEMIFMMGGFWVITKSEAFFAKEIAKIIETHKNNRTQLYGLFVGILVCISLQVFEIMYFFWGSWFSLVSCLAFLAVYISMSYSLGFLEMKEDSSPTRRQTEEELKKQFSDSNLISNFPSDSEGNNLESKNKIKIRFQKAVWRKFETVDQWRTLFGEMEDWICTEKKVKGKVTYLTLYNQLEIVQVEPEDEPKLPDYNTVQEIGKMYLDKFYEKTTITKVQDHQGNLLSLEEKAPKGHVLGEGAPKKNT